MGWVLSAHLYIYKREFFIGKATEQRSIKTAKVLAESMKDEVFVKSEILGYRIASCGCDYGGVRQRWLVIESEKRRDSDLKQLEKRLTKQLKIATSKLKRLFVN